MGATPHLPQLAVVPLELIRRHETIDPLRVERLKSRIESERIQVNPMVCCVAPEGELVLLDGATRTETFKRIGLEHAVVQLVDPGTVDLQTWHHVVRGCSPEDVVGAAESHPNLTLDHMKGTPSVHTSGGVSVLVRGIDLSSNATLTALVQCYVGRWNVSRVTDPSLESVAWAFPDWAAIAEFPTLTIEDVMNAAVTNDLLPPGITRFLVPERALRLNVPLELLAAPTSAEDKQVELDRVLEDRASEGRIRRYEEPVYILDD